MYNVELYNLTQRVVMENNAAKTEAEAAKLVKQYIATAKKAGTVISESAYDLSPRCHIFGQEIDTDAGKFRISTARS